MRIAPLLFALLWAPQESTIPNPAALLKDVTANQQRMDVLRENYTWTRNRTTEQLTGNNKVDSTASEQLECFFVNGRAVRRLVKKDGRDLNPEERAKEDERVNKRVAELLKMQPPTKHGGELSLISEILPVASVSNPHRVDFRGRPTLTFDFVGDRKAIAHSMEQKAAKNISGAIWIDEADRQIARLEVTFHDTFRIGGGLVASFQKGTVIELNQVKVEEGLWMSSAVDEHLQARIMLVKGIHANVHVRDTGFRKFDVGVKQKIAAP